jgi:quinol monooxygenase YgiN
MSRPTPETNSIIRNAQTADHPPTRLAATLTVKCEKLEQERDEAREAFKEMWRSGDAFLPHVDSETINRWRKAAGWEETK